MKCQKCNFETSKEIQFCPKCGSEISSALLPKKLDASQPKAVKENNSKKKKRIMLIAIVAGIVVFCALVLYFVIYPFVAQANGDYSVIINMYNISEYKIPKGTTEIKAGAFGSSKPQRIIIPDSVVNIDDDAFKNFVDLKSVELGAGIKTIGNRAFMGCSNLDDIYIPNGVISIGEEAFSQCDTIRWLIIPDSVSYIGERAFSECKNLEHLEIGNGITTINDNTFSTCKNLIYVKISNSVTDIGFGAFSDCNIRYLVIPEGVEYIKTAAFSWNTKMSEVKLPKSLKCVEQTAFCKCNDIEAVYYAGSSTEWYEIDIDPNLNEPLLNAPIYFDSNYQ